METRGAKSRLRCGESRNAVKKEEVDYVKRITGKTSKLGTKARRKGERAGLFGFLLYQITNRHKHMQG